MSEIEARNLAALRSDYLIFEEISFTLAAGEALVVTGPNGSGKTTLLRQLAGFVRPAHGQLLWNGVDVFADRVRHGERIGWLGHLDAIKPALSARDNLLPWVKRGKGEGQDAAVARVLSAVDLAEHGATLGRFLSAGQRRRLALARLLLAEAPLWLLDEPVTALDVISIDRLGELLAAHRAQGGMVVAATHADLPLPQANRLLLG